MSPPSCFRETLSSRQVCRDAQSSFWPTSMTQQMEWGLCSVPSLPDWPDGLKIVAAYNDAHRHCAEKHGNVHLTNLHDGFLGHGIHCTQFWTKHYHPGDPHYWYYRKPGRSQRARGSVYFNDPTGRTIPL